MDGAPVISLLSRLVLLLVHPALACPDVDGTLNRAVQHLLAADSAAVDHDFASMDDAFGCAVVTPRQVARYFVVRGGAAELATPGSGQLLFASARALDATVWESAFGPDLNAVWANAAAVGTGSLKLDTNADGGWVDGERVPIWPDLAFAGWHVVQVVTTDGRTVLFGRVVNLPTGGTSLVATGLPETGASPMIGTAGTAPTRRKRLVSPVWLVAAGVVAAAGGGLAAGAVIEGQHVPTLGTVDAVDAGWAKERVYAYGAYAAWGVAGVLGGISFVFP